MFKAGVGRRRRTWSAAGNQLDIETAVALSRRLAASDARAARWVGKDALRELTSAAVVKRLKRR